MTDEEIIARTLSAHWQDMHTNESLGRQRMLATQVVNALRDAGRLVEPSGKAGGFTGAQIVAAAKVIAPDGVFAEDFGEYSRKRDNYRIEYQVDDQHYYLLKASQALEVARKVT